MLGTWGYTDVAIFRGGLVLSYEGMMDVVLG